MQCSYLKYVNTYIYMHSHSQDLKNVKIFLQLTRIITHMTELIQIYYTRSTRLKHYKIHSMILIMTIMIMNQKRIAIKHQKEFCYQQFYLSNIVVMYNNFLHFTYSFSP